MDRDELLRLIDANNAYGLMLAATRAWLQRDHPEARYAVTLAEFESDIPTLVVPIIPPASAWADCPVPLIV
jgi:hypothetical protein